MPQRSSSPLASPVSTPAAHARASASTMQKHFPSGPPHALYELKNLSVPYALPVKREAEKAEKTALTLTVLNKYDDRADMQENGKNAAPSCAEEWLKERTKRQDPALIEP
jgi:hypothetical protein